MILKLLQEKKNSLKILEAKLNMTKQWIFKDKKDLQSTCTSTMKRSMKTMMFCTK